MPRGTGRYDEALRQGRLWTPRVFAASEMPIWLDAADLGTITSASSLVSQWNDKSGNNNHVSEATNKPLLQNEPYTSKPAVYFGSGGASKYLTASWSISKTTLYVASACTMETGTVNNGRLVSIGTTGSDDYNTPGGGAMLSRNGTGNSLRCTQNSTDFLSPTPNVTLNLPFVQGVAFNGSTGTYWLNGKAGSSTAKTPTFNSPAIRVGRTVNVVEYWVGYMFELVITSAYPSNAVVNKIDGYLAWKWGTVSALDPSHPYKNRPPLIGD